MTQAPSQQNVRSELIAARQLLRQGRKDEAKTILARAFEWAAGDAELFEEIGRSFEEAGDPEEAGRAYTHCLLTDPDRYLAHARLGNIKFQEGNIPEATFHLERASALKPEDPAVLNNLGLMYQMGDQPEKAIATLKLALEKGAAEDLVKGTLAGIYEDSNMLGPLKSLLEDTLPKYPRDFYLNLIAAQLKRREGDLPAARTHLERVTVSQQPSDAKIVYHFEMGRILDAAGDSDAAYSHFALGNRLAASEPSFQAFNKTGARQQVQNLAALDFVSWTKPDEQAGDAASAPAFLIGFPRSGTTLLTQVLDAHPDVEVLEEKPVLARLVGHLHGLSKRRETKPFPQCLETLSPEDLTSLRAHYFIHADSLRTRKSSPRLVDKFPLHILDLPLITKLFPRAKIVFALRHPCDVVLSCFMQNFGPNAAMVNFLTLEDSIAYYTEVMNFWNQCRKLIPLDLHEVRYERLVEGFEEEARALISFLGVPWNEQVLRYREQAMSKTRINTPSYHQVVKPIYQDAKARWQRYKKFLDPHLSRLEPFCKDYGYEL